MRTLIVVSRPDRWSIRIPGVEVVPARRYLTDPEWARIGVRVYNLCRSYRYQSVGYYVSLLAEARGHRPLPSVGTIQGLKSPSLARFYSEELEDLIARSLRPIQGDSFTLSIYFGRNLARRYDRLSLALFNLFPAPLLRAMFQRDGDGWQLVRLAPIATSEVPESHHEFAIEQAARFLSRPRPRARRETGRYDLALLVDPDEELPPSDEGALRRFERVGRKLGISVERIGKDDAGSLSEFDALFIRTTTSVTNHTFRFAQRAAADGLVVIDDPDSILRCSNKVYLAELLSRHDIPAPRTLVIHRDNVERVEAELGLPCVLKQPDSAFSLGVVKVHTPAELAEALERMLEESDLVIGQEFLPTDFDWRIGVLDGRPLFAARYFMVKKHWQIARHGGHRGPRFGGVEAVAIEDVPRAVVRSALRATRPIGDGLYGVDVKQNGRRTYVVEVNDNPNVDSGGEDRIVGEELYRSILGYFVERIETRRAGERH